MPGKYTEGYTKSAQKQKFVRHRDIKMKESELKKEAKIQKLMCEGVCKRCREKVQWRFKYDKYKPLKNPATCQNCKQKTVTKAYRTLCDRCAQSKKQCPSCCEELELIARLEESAEERTTSAAENGKTTELDVDEVDETEMETGDIVEKSAEAENDCDGLDEEEHVELGMDLKWDQKKFMNIAASKYSKSRAIGVEDEGMV